MFLTKAFSRTYRLWRRGGNPANLVQYIKGCLEKFAEHQSKYKPLSLRLRFRGSSCVFQMEAAWFFEAIDQLGGLMQDKAHCYHLQCNSEKVQLVGLNGYQVDELRGEETRRLEAVFERVAWLEPEHHGGDAFDELSRAIETVEDMLGGTRTRIGISC